jgi:hypothetical protein
MARRNGSRRQRRGGVLGWMGEHRGVTIVLAVVLVVIVAVVVAKLMADSAATSDTDQRADEVRELLSGATPDDFLAFNAGVQQDGSVAQHVRDQPDFVNVRATADLSFIRFQPEGWWSGFTERCIVASVRADGVTVDVPKSACVRVEAPNS